MLSGLEISSTRKHARAWLQSRNLLTREPSSTLLLQIFPLKVSHPNYICQCSQVSPRGLVSPTSVVWVCCQTVSWHLIKSLQLISGAQTATHAYTPRLSVGRPHTHRASRPARTRLHTTARTATAQPYPEYPDLLHTSAAPKCHT